MPGKTAEIHPTLAVVETVDIDHNAPKFKYILCKIYLSSNPSDSKLIVRGSGHAEFHSDIYDQLDAELEDQGIVCECLGGGKIEHHPEAKTILVSGKSQGYGQADHATTVDILKEKYRDYSSVQWTND